MEGVEGDKKEEKTRKRSQLRLYQERTARWQNQAAQLAPLEMA